jgi:hypothetical protein
MRRRNAGAHSLSGRFAKLKEESSLPLRLARLEISVIDDGGWLTGKKGGSG